MASAGILDEDGGVGAAGIALGLPGERSLNGWPPGGGGVYGGDPPGKGLGARSA